MLTHNILLIEIKTCATEQDLGEATLSEQEHGEQTDGEQEQTNSLNTLLSKYIFNDTAAMEDQPANDLSDLSIQEGLDMLCELVSDDYC